jgi:hypothetical protein
MTKKDGWTSYRIHIHISSNKTDIISGRRFFLIKDLRAKSTGNIKIEEDMKVVQKLKTVWSLKNKK